VTKIAEGSVVEITYGDTRRTLDAFFGEPEQFIHLTGFVATNAVSYKGTVESRIAFAEDDPWFNDVWPIQVTAEVIDEAGQPRTLTQQVAAPAEGWCPSAAPPATAVASSAATLPDTGLDGDQAGLATSGGLLFFGGIALVVGAGFIGRRREDTAARVED
jgi:hypothetical protein